MVKTFNEFIGEKYVIKSNPKSAEDTPECLLKIVDYLNSYKLNVNKEHVDGRVGSIKDEESCIEALYGLMILKILIIIFWLLIKTIKVIVL